MRDFKTVFSIITEFITHPFYVWGFQLTLFGLFLFAFLAALFIRVVMMIFRKD